MRRGKFVRVWGVVAVVAIGALVALALGAAVAASPARESGGPSQSIGSAEIAALTSRGLSVEQARQAIEAQGVIARADLVSRIEAALGDAFGGAWFDPAAAQLYFGATSPASGRIVDTIAARADLAGSVTATPVSSTLAQLRSAQQQWNRRLAGLLARGQVITRIESQGNAVGVELGSSVPAEERAALERQASEAAVDVSVSVSAEPHLGIDTQEESCNEFVKSEAECEAPIVSGTTFTGPEIIEEGKKVKPRCTVGPAAIKRDLSRETTETFLLTAGHCIADTGGTGKGWSAFDGNGNEEVVGQAIDYVDGTKEMKGLPADVGVIRIDNSEWIEATLTPLSPTVAPWSKTEPTEPAPVIGSVDPVESSTTCIAGQSTGYECGTVKATGVTGTNEAGKELKELVEVTGFKTEKGDSGSPWFFGFIEGEQTVWAVVEGSHVGLIGANPVYEPLSYSFKQLEKAPRELQLEALTTENETRPKCPMADTAACSPQMFEEVSPLVASALAAGTKFVATSSNALATNTALGTLSCKTVTINAELTENPGGIIKAKGLGGATATCAAAGKELTVTKPTLVSLETKGEGKGTLSMTFIADVGALSCHYAGTGDFTYTNENDVLKIAGIKMSSSAELCEPEEGSPEFEGDFTIKTESGAPLFIK